MIMLTFVTLICTLFTIASYGQSIYTIILLILLVIFIIMTVISIEIKKYIRTYPMKDYFWKLTNNNGVEIEIRNWDTFKMGHKNNQ